MEKKHYMTHIKAPRDKVWDAMLSDNTYRQWAAPFMAGTYYEGNWEAGSKIRFLAPEKDGSLSGMYAIVKESRKPEKVTLQHLGEIKNQIEVPFPQNDVALESYKLEEKDGGTTVHVDIDVPTEWAQMMDDSWPEALSILKNISETN